MAGFSSDASKSGEKWVPHIDRGEQRPRRRPGRSRPASPASGGSAGSRAAGRRGVRRPEEERDRRAERDQRRRDEGQQQVLDHVDREQGRVVARRSPTCRATAIAPSPPRNADGPRPRHGVGRMGRVRPAGPAASQTTAGRRASSEDDSGSNVQPKSEVRRPSAARPGPDRGRCATGRTPASDGHAPPIARPRRRATPARRSRRDGPAIGVIVARNRARRARARSAGPAARRGAGESSASATAVQLSLGRSAAHRPRPHSTGADARPGSARRLRSRTVDVDHPGSRPSSADDRRLARRRRRRRSVVVVLVALNAPAIWNSFFPPAGDERPGRSRSATSTTSSSSSRS